jgi:hypothetical protein
MLTTINSEGHFGSASSYDINEQWRLNEHIDVVVRTGDSKKKHALASYLSQKYGDVSLSLCIMLKKKVLHI